MARGLEGLFGLDWVPAPETGDASLPPSVVVGADELGVAAELPDVTVVEDVAALVAEGTAPELGVVCAVGQGEGAGAAFEVAARVLGVVQAWLAEPSLESSRLVVVTRGAVAAGQGAGSADVTDLAASTVWGLIRTAQSEHPDRFVLLDCDPATEPAAINWQPLLSRAATTTEPQLAHRESSFLAPRLVTVEATPDSDAMPEFNPTGTVLLTGGTSPQGRVLARHLVEQHQVRHLLLTSRQGLDHPDAEELRDELTALGAEVTIAACDVTDRSALAGLLGCISDAHPLTAVVHLAGALDSGVLQSLNATQLRHLMAARTAGAVHLDELTRDLDLSAFILFSSAAGTIGGAGYAGLASASTFVDALAHARNSQGLPALSMAWGTWESGPAAGRPGDGELARLSREGAVPLTVEEGLALFDAGLALNRPMTVGTRIDTSALRERAMAGVLSPVWRGLVRTPVRRAAAAQGGATLSLARELIALPTAERSRVVLELVRGHIAAVLGHDSAARVDENQGLMDAGIDSLTAVELRNRLTNATGLQLPTTLVFDYPTPAVLARHVEDELLGSASDTDNAPAQRNTVTADEPIAVVGMACRYPGGVSSPEELWDLVANGIDATSDFPTDRGWPEDLYDPDPERAGKSYTRRGGFLDDVAGFDAEFFGISPREALAMDPQQRLLLEASWGALERAGLSPSALKGSETGVFIGAGASSYVCDMDGVPEQLEGYAFTGNTSSVLSGRVSYSFGFEGPAVTVDTACSSSLVALHLAVQALRQGECGLALAGGVTVLAGAGGFTEFSRQRALSPEGRCRPFSADADGTAWAEGVGLVVLERLSDARRLGHRVLGVVRGSAVNQDGARSGLTAPNGPSQQRVIRAALANAGLSAGDVDAVEAHGTGTKLGDPIEAQALLATYGQERSSERPVWLGSLKSNIGHSVAAAGIGGVIKMLMALRQEELPRTLHVGEPSPFVDWDAGAVSLLTEPVVWPRGEDVRRAGISSFGASGTNAHVIVEEAPVEEPADEPSAVEGAPVVSGAAVPWVLSGGSAAGLRSQAARLHEFVTEQGDAADPASVARALARREELSHRLVVTGENREQLLAALESFVESGEVTATGASGVVSGVVRAVLVFPGQGWQWAGMGAELLECSAVFASVVDECSAVVEELAGWSVRDVLTGNGPEGAWERVDVVQPVMFTVMVALARLWESVGIVPQAVVGHSQGEIAAACVAG
ncbi:type I polyketide synthase, partial [Streptomyces sp. I05A-00742]|uniref:type I polyketide synthase n=1 Tax=Streptomyces sp. I05A-00742 TaxID=2732853 RepID=UPI001BB19719